jgi:hypothetical protein
MLFCFTRSHRERIDLRRGIDAFAVVEQTFDSENLDVRIIFVVPELGKRLTSEY